MTCKYTINKLIQFKRAFAQIPQRFPAERLANAHRPLSFPTLSRVQRRQRRRELIPVKAHLETDGETTERQNSAADHVHFTVHAADI